MNFELNEEQRIFFDSVNRFARQELADGALSRSRSEKFPFDVAARFAEMQLLGLTIAESDGGMGGSLMDAILAILAVAFWLSIVVKANAVGYSARRERIGHAQPVGSSLGIISAETLHLHEQPEYLLLFH